MTSNDNDIVNNLKFEKLDTELPKIPKMPDEKVLSDEELNQIWNKIEEKRRQPRSTYGKPSYIMWLVIGLICAILLFAKLVLFSGL